ncbi:hypothetical protein HMPREF0731_1925 [Pseudoroseomonas cervicalis ATCC 49957]|uniref:Uncharacterized protein n=1 Tax=Pseudoroseomonas cervicalis ATCC 49957 TaxID=525371 RepID=D5RLG4_9PROT|nr:hypothetical protein HMPREF0731_1925 [Pseudoroseomonas cervicalis ATCC 49957]
MTGSRKKGKKLVRAGGGGHVPGRFPGRATPDLPRGAVPRLKDLDRCA